MGGLSLASIVPLIAMPSLEATEEFLTPQI